MPISSTKVKLRVWTDETFISKFILCQYNDLTVELILDMYLHWQSTRFQS